MKKIIKTSAVAILTLLISVQIGMALDPALATPSETPTDDSTVQVYSPENLPSDVSSFCIDPKTGVSYTGDSMCGCKPKDECGRCEGDSFYGGECDPCLLGMKDLGCGCGKDGPGECGCGKDGPGECGCGISKGCDGVCDSGKVVDTCGKCGGDGTTCGKCEIVDCTGNAIPDSEKYCSLDVNKDKQVDRKDYEIVRDNLKINPFQVANEENKYLDVDGNGYLTPFDSGVIGTFISTPPTGFKKKDVCGVCDGPGKNSCGFCPGAPDDVEDIGCGCGIKKDACGRCPKDPWFGTTCEVSTCPPDIFGIKTTITGVRGLSPVNWKNIQALSKNTARGQCLNKVLYDAIAICTPIVKKLESEGIALPGTNNLDDCVGDYMAGGYSLLFNLRFYAPNANYPITKFIITKDERTRDEKSQVAGSYESYVFFNQACENVAPPSQSAISSCVVTSLEVFVSPISLIFEEGDVLSSNITNFSLDRVNCPNCFSEWRASGKAPLLVYDPDHTGDIKGPEQLFGNWTFGGNQLASLVAGPEESSMWKNGYEALGTMDSNFDGVVAGEELGSIGLWFDLNQDGVSQKGEVKTLAEAGIKKLYYKNPKGNLTNKDIELTQGYERQIGNEIIKGRSVDWYGETATSPEGIITRKFLSSTLPTGLTSMPPQVLPSFEGQSDLAKPVESKLSGMWEWKSTLVDSKGKSINFGGVLSINETTKGIKGYTFSEAQFTKPMEGANSVSVVKNFSGSKSSDGKYEFEVASNKGKIKSNFALLDNATLEGESKIIDPNGTLEYKWIASRMK